MMIRKNGQQGQRPKKAIQAVCPTLPLHANLRHTLSSQAAFSPSSYQPTAIQDHALSAQPSAPLAYSSDPRLPKRKPPLSDANGLWSAHSNLTPLLAGSVTGINVLVYSPSSTILTTPCQGQDKKTRSPHSESDRLARVGTTHPRKLSFITEHHFPWDKTYQK